MAARKKYEGSMSDFVREHPDLTTSALVEEGKKYGLKLKETLIRVVRWKEKQASGDTTPRKRGRKPGPKPAATKRGRKRGFTRPTAPAQLKPAIFTGKRRGKTAPELRVTRVYGDIATQPAPTSTSKITEIRKKFDGGKRRGRPPKNLEATQNRENLRVYRDFDGNEVVAKDLPFDKVGSRLPPSSSKLTEIRKMLDGSYAIEQQPPPEPESTAREADTFCRIVTKIGTTKARALLDELEK